jgi:hypothetical protein
METRNVKISLETATRWCNGTDNELKELAMQTYPELAKKQLPKNWDDLGSYKGWHAGRQSVYETSGDLDYEDLNDHKFIFATKEQAEASIALAQLSQLREVYRNGWLPDWTDGQDKFCIEFYKNKASKQEFIYYSAFLSFQDRETRDLFLDNFKDLIETAKPLMS